MDTIGGRIKFLRNSYSMNQKTSVKAISICKASLSSLEKGKTKPSVATLINISNHFNISLDWLIKGIPSFEKQYDNSEVLRGISIGIRKGILSK